LSPRFECTVALPAKNEHRPDKRIREIALPSLCKNAFHFYSQKLLLAAMFDIKNYSQKKSRFKGIL